MTVETQKPFPFVSVIMPVYNEAGFIRESLGAVLAQDYPADRFEVIVADGMSTDATRDLIGEMAAASNVPVRVVDNEKRIAPTGLNCAIAAARGEIIVRVDGHCEIEPDYVANCVRLLTSGEADGVGGPIETIGETGVAAAIALAMSSKFGVGGSAFRTINDRAMYVDTVAFPGYTREILERAGPFNEELVRNQDDEFNFRIRKMGGRILLAPSIRSKYYSRSSFKSLWRQYFQYGYWKVRVWQLHPAQMSWRQFIPALFVVSLLVGGLAALFLPLGLFLFGAVVGLYLSANFAAAVITGRRQPSVIPKLMIAYAILHFSYGAGFLAGLFAFAGRWFDQAGVASLSDK